MTITAASYLTEIPTRTARLHAATTAVGPRVTQYISNRASAPSAEAASALDLRAADIIAPLISDLIRWRDSTKAVTDRYAGLEFDAAQAAVARVWQDDAVAKVRAADQIISNWRRQPAFRYDRLNSSWFQRAWGQWIYGASDTASVVSTTTAPFREAAESVAELVTETASGKREDSGGDGGGGGLGLPPTWLLVGGAAVLAGGLLYLKYGTPTGRLASVAAKLGFKKNSRRRRAKRSR